ncbi:MAG: glycoside hydrolase family 32 protein [Clostridia bacterium]|nr:glycoside hydrolase family 32 protein [Clostridia bacterium]
MSQALRDARRYEEATALSIAPEERPLFHLSARVGWMNDPNGLSRYGGQYHLFYQYHPYDSHWGPMHWGHAVSADLLHWEYLPAAMAPDMPYDLSGCFSGGAIELPDGRHLLMYTGVAKAVGEDGGLREVQTQNLAFGDGVDYEKFEKNPVITAADLPEGGSPRDFRDPRLWREGDTYRALLANDHPGQGGQMLLYESADLEPWTLQTVLAENRSRLGLMWECPDLFNLDGQTVLLASAQDMLPQGFEYHNGNGTFYMLGDIDPDTGKFIERSNHAVDYGIDFYAPQTILTPDGRRVMIGWMQNWDTCNLHTASIPWFGQMILPRELAVKNGVLYQWPIRELEALRGTPVVYENVTLEDQEISLNGIEGRALDIQLDIEPDGEMYNRFAIRFANNESYHTGVSFRPHDSVLKVDRKFSGSRRAIIHQRRAKVNHQRGRLSLRLILDRFSVEVFVNGGEKVMSATLNTDLAAKGVTFFADGKLKINVRCWPLE